MKVGFAEPISLWLGVGSCALWGLAIAWRERRRAIVLARFVAARRASALGDSVSRTRRFAKYGLLSLGVMFAVDTSKSVLGQDVRPSRLERAKLAVEHAPDSDRNLVSGTALQRGIRVGSVPAHSAAVGGGFTFSAQLAHAAYHAGGVPSVVVHAAPGFNAHAPLHLVVFLHGYNGCVSVLMAPPGETHCRPRDPAVEGWNLGSFHDAAHTNTLFVVPQLALNQRDARPGAFELPDDFRDFLSELVSGPLAAQLGSPRTLADVASVHLIAHSAGYRTALAILEQGGLGSLIKSVVLFDALYGETPRFAEYIESHAATGLRFVSIGLPNGIPARENVGLLQRLQRSLGADRVVSSDPSHLAQAIAAHAIVIATGTPPHRLVPANHLAEVLRALHAGTL